MSNLKSIDCCQNCCAFTTETRGYYEDSIGYRCRHSNQEIQPTNIYSKHLRVFQKKDEEHS
jgi:hypothetical protein